MKALLVNYNYDPVWLKDYPDLDVTLYDRSDDEIDRDLTQYGQVFKTKNEGDVDYDKLGYLVENYENLPDVFLWGKSNLLKYVEKEYLDKMLSRREFAPLLRMDHKTYSDKYGVVCKYEEGIYKERADSWFFNSPDLARKDFHNWDEWTTFFRLPKEVYIPFPPGGNFILTKERVHRYGRNLYEQMRDTLPYAMHPVNAHACERSYYLLWR